MMASVQPGMNPWPAVSDAARAAPGETAKLNRISPSGPRTLPSLRPDAPLNLASLVPRRPMNATRSPSQRSRISMGSTVNARMTSEAAYRPAMPRGLMPRSCALSTPLGMPRPICVTKMRNTPMAPVGHKSGSGAVGSSIARVNCWRNVFSWSSVIRSGLPAEYDRRMLIKARMQPPALRGLKSAFLWMLTRAGQYVLFSRGILLSRRREDFVFE